MPHPSPFDMIQKASRRSTASDRWAALKANATERYPVAPPPSTPEPIPEPAARTGAPATDQPAPVLLQPPFAPPQPRHPFLDDIAQRHIQAVRSAMAPQAWYQTPAGDRPISVPPASSPPTAAAPASTSAEKPPDPQTPDA